MKKYEYATDFWTLDELRANFDIPFHRNIETRDESGWELICVTYLPAPPGPDKVDGLMYYYRRPLNGPVDVVDVEPKAKVDTDTEKGKVHR